VNTVRRLAVLAGLTLTLLAPAATALASVGPHVTLQTGPGSCELQAVMENFPPGTVQLTFRAAGKTPVRFPVAFTGDEGGSDVLVTAGPFAPGTWTAHATGAQRQGKVTLGDECGPLPASTTSTTSTTVAGQGGQTPTSSGGTPTIGNPAVTATPSTLAAVPADASNLPFTGTDPARPAALAVIALIIGTITLWRLRARKARRS
jgi:hypothetical protein